MIRAAPGATDPGSDPPSQVAFAAFARNATRRHVTPPLILSAAVAVAMVASFLAFATRLDGDGEAALHPLIERFLGNAFSRVIVVVFLTSAIYGVLQLIGVVVDRDRLSLLAVAGSDGEARASWLAFLAGRPRRPYTGAVATWADRLPGDPHDIADRYSHHRSRHAELALLPLRFCVWVLPLLGFIGTVVGIARSIVGLEAVIAPEAGGQSAEGLLAVLGGLQFAFDTTLLGLVTAIPVMLLQMVLGGRESEVTEEGHHRMLALLASAEAGEAGSPPAGPDAAPDPSNAPVPPGVAKG